jgi:hypothetical protein
MKFAENFSELLASFSNHHVNFMIVGGYAVNYYGYERSTSDLDIWVKSSAENLQKIGNALSALGFDNDSVAKVKKLSVSEPFLFNVGSKPDDVEVFNFVTGVKYEDAEPHKVPFTDSEKLTVYFISISDLIINKMLTGRTQDKLDVEMLQNIQKL